MIRILTIFFYFFTTYTYAGLTIDLTDPENLEIADIFPNYEVLRSLNFDDTGENFTLFGFKTSKTSETWDTIFEAKISAGKNGKQRIYITLASECSDKKTNLKNTTIRTNGQNVKYHRYCDGIYIYITPISKAGNNFLVNEFKKRKNVKFEFSDIAILFDATGFTKKWNSFGGDAL